MTLFLVTLLLGLARIGYIPVPGSTGFLTLNHIPVILAGVLGGPIPGFFLGLAFGLSNFAAIAPHDAWVQIPPRLLCGVVSALVFQAVHRKGHPDASLTLSSLAAALAGSLSNTLGILLLATQRGLVPSHEVGSVLLFHGAPEAFLAVLVVLPVSVTFHRR